MLTVRCPFCLSKNTIKNGGAKGCLYRYCKDCNHSYSEITLINMTKKKPICLFCGGKHVHVYQVIKNTGKIRYYCVDCKKYFSDKTIPPLPNGLKMCHQCREIKTLDNFFKTRSIKDGHSNCCRQCINNKGKRFIKYGITKVDYDNLLIKQNNQCAICGIHLNVDNSTRAHIDHCHKTGIIRGILCHACNKMLGFARDNVVILEKSIEYLKKVS